MQLKPLEPIQFIGIFERCKNPITNNMTQLITRLLVGVTIIVAFHGYAQSDTNQAGALVIERVIHAIEDLKTCQFEMRAKERIDNTYVFTHSAAYVNYEPRKIFMRAFNENGGLKNEILYIEGQNNGDALVASLGFPFINLNLAPLGSTMRSKKQLTILEAGGKFLGEMLAFGYPNMLKNDSKVKVDLLEVKDETHGKMFHLTITNTDYAFAMVSTEGESSLRVFCNDIGVPEYKVLEINDNIDAFDDEVNGLTLLVPNYFCKVIKMKVRASDFMPISVSLFDEKGLYAQYAYDLFRVNPEISPQVFNKDNPAYTF